MTALRSQSHNRLRAQVASAERVLSAAWPLKTFVAVNPLGGVEHLPFEEAVRMAGDLLGLRGHLPLERFRALHVQGRINDADLDAALLRRLPELAGLDPVLLGERPRTALQVLRTDLLHGEEPAKGAPRPRGAGQWCDTLLGTRVAEAVDGQVSKWCAAFFDTAQAHWSMPGREHGLYGSWRALVASDPALRRLRLSQERFTDLPERPEDAVLGALAALNVPEGEHRGELRAQLARTPGWASQVKWRGEHPDQAPHPADLVDLLAMRLTYEAALVEAATSQLPYGSGSLRALIEVRLVDERPLSGVESGFARACGVARALGASTPGGPALNRLRDVLERLPATEREWVWLDAYEWHYRDRLLTALDRPAPPERTGRPPAQAVFCIDARSEGLRRHLEDLGPYQTFGFAGFYQLAIRYRGLSSPHEARLCPAPLTPNTRITELPAEGAETEAARGIAAERHSDALARAFHGAKDDLASPFALAEAAGWVAGPLSAVRTAAPALYTRLRGRLAERATRRTTDLTVNAPDWEEAEALARAAEHQGIRALLARPGLSEQECEEYRLRALAGGEPRLREQLALTQEGHADRVRQARRLGSDVEEQVLWAQTALRTFGLVENFARIVLLAGHGSHTENNAYEAALDCGACGGQRGGPNARAACAILNRPQVRAALAERGTTIPDDTVFVAAEHDTATDRVRFLDAHTIPGTHRADIDRLRADLATAGSGLARERAEHLPGAAGSAYGRAADWAQVRPEWGLARHAAFIIGPGEMVRGLDLQTRTFLHSYDWRVDPDGTVLETILTAPGLVVQGINAQYYFSSVDPRVLGAGDKTLHNVVGEVGVLEGHSGDLRLGLPWQSVGAGDRLYHEPMRALYAVEAPIERVDVLIARNDLLKNYFDGGWVSLVLREGPERPWQRRRRDGQWELWSPAVPAERQVLAAAGAGDEEQGPSQG
ncbi:DUF2309 domain-containing protein [Nocardiopsis exhalans]|uniref:Probable inorganic carbon transporter subunit DabA n=2 Tax=Nocardiopsis TaxID=2013 RepID=A0A840W3C4_9ACTN|nr:MULTISPECIES: DUF2309 domain-containing protein [Nocardiopsis]MBB5490474.1 hypothetical protein [Nocardiopsis metallicus]USY23010.1 DUF2309 domain-containing protein [Nocardiopsis exhalans]